MARISKTRLLETAAVVMQMPEAASGGAASGDTEVVKRKVAKHELLDQSGNLLPEDQGEESAYGVRYTLLANGETFEYMYGKSADADRMLANFGAKTLATNETSAARNNTKGEASPDEQIAAVRERFALLQTGQWVDRTRDGVGAKVDLDALAEAICRVLVREGKLTQEQVDSGYKAGRRQKLDDDKLFARKVRTNAAVAAEYAAIVGRQTATTDDLLA